MKYIPYDSRDYLYKTPFGAVSDSESVTIRLLLHDEAKCSAAYLSLRRDGEAPEAVLLSPSDYYDSYFRFYKAELKLTEGLYFYSFYFDSYYGRKYVTRTESGDGIITVDGGEWQLTVFESGYTTPDRFAGGIIYQIFPDRFFCSGSVKKDIPEDRFIKTDKESIPEYRQNNGICSLGNDYYGGDLEGITGKLGYLESLGVSIIYLNPIFEAHSNHRYNTADYLKIDPMLGDTSDLKRLCREAQKHGISVILDGVFSHTGDDSRYFNRYVRYDTVGAFNSKESEYFGWYRFKHWPDKYSAWWGVPSLPETDEENESYSEFITGENGVLRRWLRCGVSGWRLDVADELPDSFLDRIRTAVKAEKPDAIIIGEVWEDATSKISYGHRRRYLRGRQLDSVMNYPFASALISFLTGGDASDFCETVCNICENYPRQALRLLMNHIGTHDTVRILTALGGEKSDGKDREWQSGKRMPPYVLEKAKKLLYLAAVIQYTLPGIPSLYYGDEAGTEGYGDPFCRAFYPWGKEDCYLLGFYRTLGKFRRSSEAFSDGDFCPVFAAGSVIAYIRKCDTEQVLICVNRSEYESEIPIDSDWESAEIVFGYLPENGTVKINGLGFTVLKKKKSSH